MRHSLLPASLVAILALAYTSSTVADEITQESVEQPPDPAQFNRHCENLIRQVLQQVTVGFAMSSAELGSDAHSVLDEIVEIATDCPELSIKVTGHTDNTGNETFNRALSQARAESVVAYLTDHGIEPERLMARGTGSDTPIASNDDAAGRRVNRRIEFALSFE